MNYAFTVPTAEILPYTFEIKLIAQSTLGCSDTAKFNLTFNPLPKAVFTTVETIACPPFGVRINNTSAYSDEFKWYLDGALVSTQKEPLNIILDKSETQYRLKLVVSNIYNCSIDSIEKTLATQPKPKADFTLRDSISCNGKLDLQVTNTTTGATTYKWDFGDNTPVSTQRTPTHTYGVPGTYNLTIIAYGTLCSDTLVKQIKISSPPNAAFKASGTTGCTKVTATFENLSDNPSTYLWDFGDGTFSTESNPTHNFTFLQSPYTIKLIAIGENGCADTTVTLNYITVTTPPKAEFTVLPDSLIKIPHKTFNFKNLSSEDAINFKWEFGDGKVSEIKNPEYTYADTGSYVVKLISFNKEGCSDTLTRNVRVDGFPGYLFIPNAFEPANPQLHLKTFLVKASGLKEFKMKIFNKWGNLVWQSDKLNENGEPLESWDGYMNGEPAPQGVYIWDISARFIDGNEWKGMKYEKGKPKHTGTVHLIR